MRRLFVLREHLHLQSMLACVNANWESFANAGQPLGVTVAPYKSKRSLEQNALMWVWLTQIATDGWVGGRRFSAEAWHEHLKRELLPEVNNKGKQKWEILPTGERVLAMGTTDLDVGEMHTYLEKLCAYAAMELGLTLKNERTSNYSEDH